MSYYKGLHFSGYTNCYKKCDNWCEDTSSPYFRTSAVDDKSRNGVAFNENGHKPLKNRLVTAGIRWEDSAVQLFKFTSTVKLNFYILQFKSTSFIYLL